MITQENFEQLLQTLNFQAANGIFKKSINGADLEVNFNKKEIIYPEGLKVNERQTCNFSSNENFVVFECVYRLLEKGYSPEHLELEPRWQLGRGASGGRADILVHDRQNKALLLIECKTAGAEFEREKKKMQSNGGQLFSYLAQDRNTQYLCLYASDFDNNIQYNNLIVKIKDRKEDEEAFTEDDTIKLYKNAKSNKELFEVWKETYNLYFHFNGIFEDDVNAYKIELKPLKKKNLKPLAEAQGIFNIFMEILRHNNISDNANAFNRMLSLLLCKIVDEKKGDNEVLDFQVKEEEDTPEKIQDRLQKLYAQGMKEHLDEEIVYFEDKVILDIIKKYPRQTPIDKVEDIFRQIKYYTQNEFALKEVHNETLFRQNARVLNEVIKMLQNYRFLYTKKQQILGDFFELLLSHGVKQSEGQFFTPVPIVRFIILSLGLDKITHEKISKTEKSFLPKILDYACGSGHFLTESIDELQKHILKLNKEEITDKDLLKSLRKYKDCTEWAKEYIYGIEKDYRLARTSQIACFLNGDGDANIIYGDGLIEHERLNIKKKPFDVVIANPPYSIKACKNYLQINSGNYQVYDCLTETSSEIEAFFVERTAQVLKENGKAGIILPSSILSSGNKPYQKAREILLENFEIKAIAEFGSGTFGATGTNTVVLFLQKRSVDFKIDRKYISEDLFNGVTRKRKLEHIDSAALLQKFVNYRRIVLSDYQSLLNKQANQAILKSELWQEYKNAFSKDTDEVFYKKVLAAEEEKFYYFMLSLNDKHQSQKTILVKSGEKETAKAFLGYEFSNRKGSEGIKIFRDSNNKPTTKLYDDDNHDNAQKANSYILKNFWNEGIKEIDESIKEHISIVELTNMLDFDRKDFNKALSTNPKQNVSIEARWETVKLGEVVDTQYGYTAQSQDEGEIRYLRITDITEDGFLKNVDKKYIYPTEEIKNKYTLNENDIVIARSGSTGRMLLYKNIKESLIFASYLVRIKTTKRILPEFIFYYHQTECYWNQINNLTATLAQPNLNAEKMKQIRIPLPPLDVQQQIVDECEAVDKEVEQAHQTIITNKQQIEDKVQEVVNADYEIKKIDDISETSSGGTPLSSRQEYYENGTIPWINSGEVSKKEIKHADNFITKLGLQNSNAKLFPDNTILLAMYGATAGKVALLKIEASTNQALCAILLSEEMIPKFLLLILESMYQDLLNMRTGVARDNLSQEKIKNIKIPVPPLEIQKHLVTQVEKLEEKITESQAVMNNAAEHKNAILKKYL